MHCMHGAPPHAYNGPLSNRNGHESLKSWQDERLIVMDLDKMTHFNMNITRQLIPPVVTARTSSKVQYNVPVGYT